MRAVARHQLLSTPFRWQTASWMSSANSRGVPQKMGLLDKVRRILPHPRWTPPPPPPGIAGDGRLLELRLADTEARKRDTFQRAGEVDTLTFKLHQEAERNHFGEAIHAAMQRRHA